MAPRPQLKIDWSLVRHLASRNKINPYTYHQWYHRRTIPHKYRMQFAEQSGGRLTLAHFEAMDRANRRRRFPPGKVQTEGGGATP